MRETARGESSKAEGNQKRPRYAAMLRAGSSGGGAAFCRISERAGLMRPGHFQG